MNRDEAEAGVAPGHWYCAPGRYLNSRTNFCYQTYAIVNEADVVEGYATDNEADVAEGLGKLAAFLGGGPNP